MTFKIYVEDPSYVATVVAAVGSVSGLSEVTTFDPPPSGDESYIAVLPAGGGSYTLPIFASDDDPTTLPANPRFVITQPTGGEISVYRPITDLYGYPETPGFFFQVTLLDSEEASVLQSAAMHFSYSYDQ